jgi:hypothetical protein
MSWDTVVFRAQWFLIFDYSLESLGEYFKKLQCPEQLNWNLWRLDQAKNSPENFILHPELRTTKSIW